MHLPNLNHLKYFADAVELKSISAAARKNLISSPAVSRAINAIENQLGVTLLIHKKKSFEVTSTGLFIAEKAKNLLKAADIFNSGNTEKTDAISGIVTIGISRTLGHAYLNLIIKNLKKAFPQIKLNVRFGTTVSILEKIASNSIDLGITIGYQPMATLKQNLLKRGQFLIVSSHPKAKILSQSFILTEPRPETEILKKKFHQKYKKQLIVQNEIESWDMIAELVSSKLELGLIPDIAITSDRKNKLYPLLTDWFECPYEIYLNQSKMVSTSQAVRTLSTMIVETIN